MEFLKDAQRATVKTNKYISDNGDSLIDLLLLLVTPIVALDVLRQFFSVEGPVWIGMSFVYVCTFMLIPTLWLRSTVESKDPDRDFISYLGSSKTYLTNLILVLVAITYIKIPHMGAKLDSYLAASHNFTWDHSNMLITIVLSLFFLRLSFLVPLYLSGLDLTITQALQATKGKALALATTIIVSAFPLILFTGLYVAFLVPWMIDRFFVDVSQTVITMILLAPAKYLSVPLIMIYSFTALAYHYANYAKQYLVMSKDEAKTPPPKKEMH